MNDLSKQILDAKKIELNKGDVLIITFSTKDNYSDDAFLDDLLEMFNWVWKDKDAICVFLPENIKVNKSSKEETIKSLEQIIETLKA